MDFSAVDTAVYCSLLALLATAVLDAAFRPDETTRFTKRLVTQRRRYAYGLFAESIFAASAAWLLSVDPPGRLWTIVSGLFKLIGPASLLLDLGLILIPVNLTLLPICFLYIYRRPVPVAFRSWRGKGYCPTAWCRDGYRGFVQESQLASMEGLDVKALANATPQDFGASPT